MSQIWSVFAAVRRDTNLDEPALSPPPGVEPHFSKQSPEQAWYYVVAVLGTVVTGSLYILRMYTKIRIVRKVDITDCKKKMWDSCKIHVLIARKTS